MIQKKVQRPVELRIIEREGRPVWQIRYHLWIGENLGTAASLDTLRIEWSEWEDVPDYRNPSTLGKDA